MIAFVNISLQEPERQAVVPSFFLSTAGSATVHHVHSKKHSARQSHRTRGENGVRSTALKNVICDTYQKDGNPRKAVPQFYAHEMVKKYVNTP